MAAYTTRCQSDESTCASLSPLCLSFLLILNLLELWHQQRTRQRFIQLALVLGLLMLVSWLAHNTWVNLKSRGIQSGYDFLFDIAGFDIGEHFLIAYDSADHYWRAFLVGLFNTIKVSVVGLLCASLLGLMVGLARTSQQTMIRVCARAYVECIRNLPLLLQLLMWYVLLIEYLPSSESPLSWFNTIYLSQEGLALPQLMWSTDSTSHWMGMVLSWSVPYSDLEGIHADLNLSPEFMALTFALSLYTSAFIAENVRAGIESIPKGQMEAARSIGLSELQVYRFVLLPQSIQIIRPPLTNQYLNLIKNSSLAVAIGYPDLVSIANTALNQTGRALECISILMGVYLAISLCISWAMSQFKNKATRALEQASKSASMKTLQPEIQISN